MRPDIWNIILWSKSKSNRHMEPFFINIAPAPANEYEMSSHEGEEFIIVANGEIEINYGNETMS